MVRKIMVRDYMTREVVSFTPDTLILDAVSKLVQRRISGAPVLDLQGNLVGMLSDIDCFKVSLAASYHGDWGGRVDEFMTTDVVTVDAEASVLDVAEKFMETKLRRLPVMQRTRLVGQISRHDVLRAMDEMHPH
ncbi:MAG: CBS domain-containing protein [Pseudomonadota bacterium]